MINAIVIALGVAQAELAPALPFAPLTFASIMLINAVFFHNLPVLRTNGRFSPGVVSAVILFFPAGLAVWWRTGRDGVLNWTTAASAIAALLMAYPIVMLNLGGLPYFRQG